MKLQQVLEKITEGIPPVLTMDDAIYVRRRKFNAESMAKISPADDQDDLSDHGWHLLEYVQFIQERILNGEKLEDQILRMQANGLRSDQDALEVLRQVITVDSAAARYGVSGDTIRDACQTGQILALKDKDTWTMLDADAKARWGKK